MEKYKIWTKNFSLVGDKNTDIFEEAPSEEYSYSAIFNFEDDDQPSIIHLLGRGTCPKVSISKTILQFGEVKMNEKKDIEIIVENKNRELEIDYFGEKVFIKTLGNRFCFNF